MDNLGYKLLSFILRYLNLNDLSRLAQTSRKFKIFVCLTRKSKLSIFIRSPPIPINNYDLADCVYVDDIDKFFKSKLILQLTDYLEELIIINRSTNEQNLFLNHTFKYLRLLKIDNLIIKNSSILKSTTLKEIYLNRSHFNSLINLDQLKHSDRLIYKYGFNTFKNESIKLEKLNLRESLSIEFYEYCVKNNLFDNIKELEIVGLDFEPLILLIENCPKLIKLNYGINSLNSFIYQLKKDKLKEIINQLDRLKKTKHALNDLKLYLWSFEFSRKSIDSLILFFKQFQQSIKLDNLYISLTIDINNRNHLNSINQDYLTEFYNKIKELNCLELILNHKSYEKMFNLEYLSLNISKDTKLSTINSLFKSLSSTIKKLDLKIDIDVDTDTSDLFKLLPIYCKYINFLSLDNWSKNTNYDFVLQLKNLSYIKLNVRYPMQSSIIINSIRNLDYLTYLQILFLKPDTLTQLQLKTLKETVEYVLLKELNYHDTQFKIESCYVNSVKFMRYIYKRDKNFDKILASDNEREDKLIDLINMTN